MGKHSNHEVIGRVTDLNENYIGQLFKQSYDGKELLLEVNPEDLYMKITCIGCGGTGTFHITDDDSQTCVECKGSGEVFVSLI